MASLTTIINKLIREGKLPGDSKPDSLSEEQWNLVSEELKIAQSKSFEEGNRVGIREGLTPAQQAKKDSENPHLKDPVRDSNSSESKG